MDLADLTEADCPLLRSSHELRERFNRLAAKARLIDEHLGGILDRPMPGQRRGGEAKTPLALLADLRRNLSRKQYQVGFLGPTGAGKSTTLNSVLGDPSEPPGEPGGSQATTSTVMRLNAISSGEPRMVLRYLGPAQYDVKRKALAARVGIDEHVNEQSILGLLPSLRSENAAGQLMVQVGDASSPVKPGDIEYLDQMIRAYMTADGRRLVANGGSDVEVPYASRRRYLNYGSQADPYNRLIREAEIHFPTSALPGEVQMVDLPGLGASTSVDTMVTNEFLGELDGALVLFRGDKLSDSDAEDLLLRMRSYFGSLVGRVWVVITKIDGLTRPQLMGNQVGSSLFSAMSHIHREFGVPLDQFYLVSNEYTKHESEYIAGTLKVKIDGVNSVPPPFQADPTLKKSFEALLDHGGIPRIRRLVSDELAHQVEGRVRAAAEADIATLSAYLSMAAKTEARRLSQGSDARTLCSAVHKRMQQTILTLEDQHGGFEAEAERLSAALLSKFDAICLSAEEMQRLDSHRMLDLGKDFRRHADDLHDKFHDELESVSLLQLYSRVQADLDVPPQVPVLAFPEGQAAAWREFTQEDRSSSAPWRKKLPGFRSETLLHRSTNGDAAAGSLDGAGYIDVMHEKIQAVGEQTIHAIRRQIRRRLMSLIDELDRVINSTPRSSSGTIAKFDDVLKRIEELGDGHD